MTAPAYITIQLRRPRDDDPGLIDEAWFTVDGGAVQLVDRDGVPLHGELTRRTIRPDETTRQSAARLLRARSRSRPPRPFSRKLHYPRVVY